jgi:hypothetical protein
LRSEEQISTNEEGWHWRYVAQPDGTRDGFRRPSADIFLLQELRQFAGKYALFPTASDGCAQRRSQMKTELTSSPLSRFRGGVASER